MQQVSLSEFCEPFFLEVCAILRSPYSGVSAEPWPVRDRLKKQLDALLEQSSKIPGLDREYTRIEWVLAVFADIVILDSTLPFAKLWTNQVQLASDPRINIKTGRATFFEELGKTLSGMPVDTERLAIFQTCLGLGFGGIYRDDPAKLRAYSEQILQRLESPAKRGNADLICPEAYEHTQTKKLFEPVMEKLLAIAIVCGAVLLAIPVAYIWSCLLARQNIEEVLGHLTR